MKSARLICTIVIMFITIIGYSQKKQEVVILKIQQNYTLLKADSYILISYPDESTKTIKLVDAALRANDAGESSNASVIQMEINALTKEGYEIVSTSISGDYQFTKTLIALARKKE